MILPLLCSIVIAICVIGYIVYDYCKDMSVVGKKEE